MAEWSIRKLNDELNWMEAVVMFLIQKNVIGCVHDVKFMEGINIGLSDQRILLCGFANVEQREVTVRS